MLAGVEPWPFAWVVPLALRFASLVFCAIIAGPCVGARRGQDTCPVLVRTGQQNRFATLCCVAPTIVKGVVGVLLLWEAPF